MSSGVERACGVTLHHKHISGQYLLCEWSFLVGEYFEYIPVEPIYTIAGRLKTNEKNPNPFI